MILIKSISINNQIQNLQGKTLQINILISNILYIYFFFYILYVYLNMSLENLTNKIETNIPDNYGNFDLQTTSSGINGILSQVLYKDSGNTHSAGSSFDLELQGNLLMMPNETYCCFPIEFKYASKAYDLENIVNLTLRNEVASMFRRVDVMIDGKQIFSSDYIGDYLSLIDLRDMNRMDHEDNTESSTLKGGNAFETIDRNFFNDSYTRRKKKAADMLTLFTIPGTPDSERSFSSLGDNATNYVVMLPLTHLGWNMNLYPLFLDGNIKIKFTMNSFNEIVTSDTRQDYSKATDAEIIFGGTSGQKSFTIKQPYVSGNFLDIDASFVQHVVQNVVESSAESLGGNTYKFQHVKIFNQTLNSNPGLSYNRYYHQISHSQSRVDAVILYFNVDSNHTLPPYVDSTVTTNKHMVNYGKVLDATPANKKYIAYIDTIEKLYMDIKKIKLKMGGTTIPIDERMYDSVYYQYQQAKILFPHLTLDKFLTDHYMIVFPLFNDRSIDFASNMTGHQVSSPHINVEFDLKIPLGYAENVLADNINIPDGFALGKIKFNIMVLSNNILIHRGFAASTIIS